MDLDRGLHAVVEDLCLEPTGGSPGDPAAEDHCRSAGCGIMDLTFVNLQTVLPPFYRRLGYTENGAEPFPVPSKVPCHLVKMTKPLA